MSQYDNQEYDIARRRAIAQALQASGNFSPDQITQTSGRMVVPISPWASFSKLLTSGAGIYSGMQADKEAKALQEQKQKDSSQWMDQLQDQAQMGSLTPQAASTAPMQPTDPSAHAGQLNGMQMQSGGDDLSQYGDINALHSQNEASQVTDAQQRKAQMMGQYMQGLQLGGVPAALSQQGLERIMTPKQYDPVKLAQGEVLKDPMTGGLIARGDPKPPPVRASEPLVDWVDPTKKGGYSSGPRDQMPPGAQQFHPSMANQQANQAADALGPDAVDLGAVMFLQDDTAMNRIVGYGPSSKANRKAVTERAAAMLKETGIKPQDLVRLRGNAKAQGASMTDMTKTLNRLEPYEALADNNGERIAQLVDKVNFTGAPKINDLIQGAAKFGGNTDDVGEFRSVLKTFQAEAARIITQPDLKGVLSDSARHELEQVVDGTLPGSALKRVINRIGFEMNFRRSSIQQQIQKAGDSMSIFNGTPMAPQPQTPVQMPTDPNAAPGNAGLPDDIAALVKKHGGH